MEEPSQTNETFKEGEFLDIEITKIANFGAFAKLPFNRVGLIHISQITDGFVRDINEYLKVGDRLKARVLSISENGRVDLSLRKEASTTLVSQPKKRIQFKNPALEEKLKIFLKQSQERLADLKRREESRLGKK
ncbi:MAG: S1 RNA-binding domain-containing protein [Candidatus Omnitrophica bacterium]|nr:S1 RNA-binding domain-containing protein [Candidatus Omnitrophota bacterium]